MFQTEHTDFEAMDFSHGVNVAEDTYYLGFWCAYFFIKQVWKIIFLWWTFMVLLCDDDYKQSMLGEFLF